jgi:thioredoxin 1
MKKAIFIFIIFTFVAVIALQYSSNPSQSTYGIDGAKVYAKTKSNHDSVEAFKKAFDNNKPIIVEFYSKWCGTCRIVGPVYESVIPEYSDKFDFFSFDVDKNPKLSDNFNVMYLPTIYAINPADNKIEEIPTRHLMNKASFSKKLDTIMNSYAVKAEKPSK